VLTQEENPEPRSQAVTVLFADIWSFTRLAENTNPSLLLELLNEFFEEMVTALNARGGIVDKFMGDSLMSLFGVPDPDPSGAGGALRAAVEMHERLDRLNQRRRLSGRPEFRMAIGLSHGQAITGNVGSTQRTDYTAVGDTVNLASRLERLNRQYNTSTLLTEAAVSDAEEAGVVVREIDLIRVRGRTQVTRLFELAWREDTAADWQKYETEWQAALGRYRSGAFPEATDRFRALEEAMPGDPVAELYLERLERLTQAPPENEWDGVFKVDV
jgi:adenylate cyclase